jgi:energy-coupling factor transporter transmembrane protein EcfT
MRRLDVSLIRRTFERADKLAFPMEARCYSEERTDPVLTSKATDCITQVTVIGLCVVMVSLP